MAADWLGLPFAEAVAYLLGLKPTPKDVFQEMSIEQRQESFTAARITKMEFLQGLLDALQEASTDGKTLKEFVEEQSPTGLTPAHLETIYRTNVQSAFGRGRFQRLTDRSIAGAVWGWKYRTVGDDRVREAHAALEGLVFQTGTHNEVFPPWGFNCRCSSEIVTKREARKQELESDELPEVALEELGSTDFASPALGIPTTPDLGGYDLGLVGRFVADQGRAGNE